RSSTARKPAAAAAPKRASNGRSQNNRPRLAARRGMQTSFSRPVRLVNGATRPLAVWDLSHYLAHYNNGPFCGLPISRCLVRLTSGNRAQQTRNKPARVEETAEKRRHERAAIAPGNLRLLPIDRARGIHVRAARRQ